MPQGLFGNRDEPPPVAVLETAEGEVPETARTVDDFDTTTAGERAAALQRAESEGGQTDLGVTIATLGDVTQTGIWLKTPLVSQAAKGRVELSGTGASVAVDLIPLEAEPGAGSRISLAAMRLLEIDLTSLAELRVYRFN